MSNSILTGFDIDGRPIIYMRPGRENTETSPRQLRHLVYILYVRVRSRCADKWPMKLIIVAAADSRERAKDLMPPGQESLMILVDYKSTTLRTNPSISVARKVLAILQYHYVESLGRALVVNLPTILSFFYKGIAPFLDPVTREKMRFNPDLFELVPREQLDADFGGDYEYEFDHEAYWNQLIKYVKMRLRSPRRIFIYLKIDRACGIAPDGTRIAKTEPDSGIPTHGQPRGIPSKMDRSPRYSIGVLLHSRHELTNCSGVSVRRLLARRMINPSPLLIAMSVWAL